jgi:hypothetical protein
MSQRSSGKPRRRLLVGAIALATAAAGVATLAPQVSTASSHREAPLIAGEPRLDNTDLYAFVSPDKPDTVTLIANYIPFQEPNGGPNFYAFAQNTAYDVNIDSDGDALADITYRWSFKDNFRNQNTFLYNTGVVNNLTDETLNFVQTYNLERITRDGRLTLVENGIVAPSRTGEASMPDYRKLSDQAVVDAGAGIKAFAGQADDPFFADLRVFDLLYGADLSKVGQNTLKGFNVNTLALQIPKQALALNGDAQRNPVIGIWASTARSSTEVIKRDNVREQSDDLVQVSRLGMPLVNEVVIPVGKKDEFNASHPSKDEKFLKFVQEPEVPKLIEQIYMIPAPDAPRDDLVEVFLTGVCKECNGPIDVDLNSQLLNQDVDAGRFRPSEQLRLNMSIAPAKSPNRLGVVGGDTAGFPNGRRLADDVIDVTLQAAEGVLLGNAADAIKGLGDAVDANEQDFRGHFPYVAVANTKAVNES